MDWAHIADYAGVSAGIIAAYFIGRISGRYDECRGQLDRRLAIVEEQLASQIEEPAHPAANRPDWQDAVMNR